MKSKNLIIWDWNGTLLDDVDICLESINELLLKRNIDALHKSRYRQIFTFPVKDYYIKAGFDFTNEPFDKVAMEFINLYHEKILTASLFDEVREVLQFFRQIEYQQLMISAMEHNSLVKSVHRLGISDFFDHINGIEDHYAESKIMLARKVINDKVTNGSKITLIGDTLHDAEVAKDLGIDCLLIARGHQSYNRLLKSEFTVVHNLKEVMQLYQ